MSAIIENQYGYFIKPSGSICLVAETIYGDNLRDSHPFRYSLHPNLRKIFIVLPTRFEFPYIKDALHEIVVRRFDCDKYPNEHGGPDLHLLRAPLPTQWHAVLCEVMIKKVTTYPIDPSCNGDVVSRRLPRIPEVITIDDEE